MAEEAQYEIGWVTIPITQLVKADWNYKRDGSDEQRLSNALRQNMMRNGQIENIIVRRLDTGFYEIVNGNHRYDVMVELGWPEVHCYNLGTISLRQAQRIAVETNETKFPHDNLALANIITEIAQEFDVADLVETMPYTEEEIGRFVSLGDFDWSQYGDGHTQEEYLVDNPMKKVAKVEFTDQQILDEFNNCMDTIRRNMPMTEEEEDVVLDGDRLVAFLREHIR